MQLSHLPLRIATGAFILNSGLNKRGMDPESAAGVHGMASNAIPPLKKLEPTQFAKLLSSGEIALGAALLVPFVPSALAGGALAGFGAGLVRLYLKTPGLRQEGSIKPTEAGTGIAKDVWLLGAGLTLAIEGVRKRRVAAAAAPVAVRTVPVAAKVARRG